MVRRQFLKWLGVVPAIVPVYSGVMNLDGKLWAEHKDKPGLLHATVFTYGRVEYQSKAMAKATREEWERRVDQELAQVKADYMRNYDRMIAGEAPVSVNSETGEIKYVDQLL